MSPYAAKFYGRRISVKPGAEHLLPMTR